MKNACRINDDGSVSILLNSKAGSFEAVITKEDYEKHAEPFKGTWTAYQHQRTGKFYARGTYRNPETKKVEQPMLHRLIMNPGKGEIAAHINGNTLDCRPENMRNVPIGTDINEIIEAEKALEEILEGAELKNTSKMPYSCSCGQLLYSPGKCGDCLAKERQQVALSEKPLKGVSFHKGKNKWEVSPFYEGKRYRLGYWLPDKLEEANIAVQEFRYLGPEEYFKQHPKGVKK